MKHLSTKRREIFKKGKKKLFLRWSGGTSKERRDFFRI
jgi:hypothetical protein